MFASVRPVFPFAAAFCPLPRFRLQPFCPTVLGRIGLPVLEGGKVHSRSGPSGAGRCLQSGVGHSSRREMMRADTGPPAKSPAAPVAILATPSKEAVRS